jgi:hypothetical protein
LKQSLKQSKQEETMSTRRKFLTTGALGGAAALAAPAVGRAQDTIRWRMQTYAGTSLGA